MVHFSIYYFCQKIKKRVITPSSATVVLQCWSCELKTASGSMRTLVICSLLAHLVPADSQVEESCAPPTLQSTPCKIKGFETFCKHWNNCTRAPAHSVSTPGGRCLYSRMGALKPDKSLREQTMSGSYSKVTFVAGPDNVAKLAAWHCTPGAVPCLSTHARSPSL